MIERDMDPHVRTCQLTTQHSIHHVTHPRPPQKYQDAHPRVAAEALHLLNLLAAKFPELATQGTIYTCIIIHIIRMFVIM